MLFLLKPYVVIIVFNYTVSLLSLVIKVYIVIQRIKLVSWYYWLVKLQTFNVNSWLNIICQWRLGFDLMLRSYFVAWIDPFDKGLLAICVNTIFNYLLSVLLQRLLCQLCVNILLIIRLLNFIAVLNYLKLLWSSF